MKLYNSLTRKVEDFTALREDIKAVSLYSCGPTVYDHVHIGNLASFIAADILKRTLQSAGYTVQHVMNFTDVDDKTIRRSRELYPDLPPMEALTKATRHFEELFLADITKIGIDTDAICFLQATESIPGMQQLIRDLQSAGIAYVTDDGVYFSIAAYKQKGRTYGQLVEVTAESTGAARVDNDEYDKESVHDFALWKVQKEGEPAWDFKLDGHDLTGRPGWHIECSAMSTDELGQPFDIHTGGVDLKFPHHENEIAQSTATTDEAVMARFFVHNEHLLVDGKKMSKSLKNFYTLRDIVDRGYDPLAFRLLVLQSHYRSQMNFTWEALDAAQNRLRDLQAWADRRHQPTIQNMPQELDDMWHEALDALQESFFQDLNSPEALAALAKLTSYMEQQAIPSHDGKYSTGALTTIDQLFGLNLDNRPDITTEQKQLIAEREEARKAQDWTKSDELRDKLVEQGIQLNDTDHGPIWSRI